MPQVDRDFTRYAAAVVRRERIRRRTGELVQFDVDVDERKFVPEALPACFHALLQLAADLADQLDAAEVGAGSAVIFHAERTP